MSESCYPTTNEMNAQCYCLPITRAAIDTRIKQRAPDLLPLLADKPTLFAGTAVFIDRKNIDAMLTQIQALEAAIALPAYDGAISARDNISLTDIASEKTRGLFMGYDFHITQDGPRLIEINTNAGGAYLVSLLDDVTMGTADIENPHCAPKNSIVPIASPQILSETFLQEWATSRPGALKTVAIVDDNPKEQYLYPELVMIARALETIGIKAVITDPSALAFDGAHLTINGEPIDMVYNRMTDFDLSDPKHSAIKAAYQQGKTLLSPSPIHHALYADKRNLILLSDPETMEAYGLGERDLDALQFIPKTRAVTTQAADELWTDRRRYFFKPKDGYGSKAAYRGAKLTKKVWAQILAGDYIAQDFIAPTIRAVDTGDVQTQLKFDIRIYTYNAQPLSIAARVYQGQTTNFRTKGGGFAAVLAR